MSATQPYTRAPQITVRSAGANDVPALAAIGALAFTQAYNQPAQPDDRSLGRGGNYRAQVVARELCSPGCLYLIAEVGGRAAGFGKLRESESPPCIPGQKPIEVSQLYVLREFRSAGVGSQLMGAMLEEARRRQADAIWLGIWERARLERAFYTKWGFVEVGSHDVWVGSDQQTDTLMYRPVNHET
ncbi:MAG: GNAT family N-acetyltransferase [Gammaproteobacteria bacterium]|nr:GNAT family N-acetyltransferase [Gammaproteobacteria bacterium]NIR83548.1 GNAT family N-acetyltransferase [Gammaproteobacteria bacterium]NIR91470.1 GNAT family N-acetyltransferase [Gammaproteobacteria bacterium]NIU04710.1 GNAT family N-acetyltransferase [Gammaproteobacteria bacterium]NIV51752.1 GNAT family N-acetyltransferase [Gammaproteobacteria bacterium]